MYPPILTSALPRKHLYDAVKESPINLAKRVYKVHPDQTGEWVMFASMQNNMVITAYSGFGTIHAFRDWRVATLSEDWVPAREDELEIYQKWVREFERQEELKRQYREKRNNPQ